MKNVTNKLKFIGRSRGLGDLGVCGNHRKWLQIHACKIWCNSVITTLISWPKRFPLFFFTFRALGVESPRGGAIFWFCGFKNKSTNICPKWVPPKITHPSSIRHAWGFGEAIVGGRRTNMFSFYQNGIFLNIFVANMYTYIYVYIDIYIYSYLFIFRYWYVYIYIYTHLFIYIYIYI